MRNRNKILSINDATSQRIHQEEKIEVTFREYFYSLFQSSCPSPDIINNVTQCITKTISDKGRDFLDKSVTQEEISQAVFSIGVFKAPGPDGFQAGFFQRYWSTVGPDIIEFMENFFVGKKDLSNINYTFIVLIPKKPNPTDTGHYHPISLCNVLYKVISKVMTNCLHTVIGKLISDNQSAFIRGRLLTDNTLLAYEVFHHMKTHKRKTQLMTTKIDMSKAYDRVEWIFLFAVMRKMGFSPKWIEWVNSYLSSTSFQVLLNGSPGKSFKP